MNRAEIKSSIEFFFEAIEGPIPEDTREARLQIALDRLALSVSIADYTFDEGKYPEAPRREYNVVRDIVSVNFPDCGYYNVPLEISEKIGESSLAVGDAIDDICDIARDMEEVLWCWENTSVDNALWHFRESFGSHWGKHLRDLQLYLYAKEHGW